MAGKEDMEVNVTETNLNKDDILTIINTNARSLCPKMDSLIDNIKELEAHIGIVTETWLSDGCGLEEDIMNFREGTGYNMLTLNRPPNNRG